jgi:hypothetical protein
MHVVKLRNFLNDIVLDSPHLGRAKSIAPTSISDEPP